MKYLVTSALPYANGKLHVGHVAGAYLPADVFVRWLRLHNQDVIYICGTDEHGTPISISADAEGVTPDVVVKRYHDSIKAGFDAIDIQFDNFSGTARPPHHETSRRFFLDLYEKGHIQARETRQFYCEHDKRYLPDRYVEGICPRCKATGARGDQCDACGQIYDTVTLIDPKCKICGNMPVVRDTKHWFIQLDDFREQLREWIAHKDYWKENVRNFMLNLLDQGLIERSITRDLSWGIPVPLPEAEGKVLYVWFDAPIGYISSTVEWALNQGQPDRWKDYWLDPETQLIHFIGKDNIIFHALIWPAMLMGQNQTYCLPHDIPANEFMNLEGQKISTSHNWAIWVDEFAKDFPGDFLRYYLAVNAPEKGDSDFSFKDFQLRINGELNNVLGNLANRVFAFSVKNFDGIIPPISYSAAARSVLEEAEALLKQIDEGFREYQVKKNTRLIMDIARLGNRWFDERKPWAAIKEDREHVLETLRVCADLLAMVSIALYPILPGSMNRLRQMMGLPEAATWDDASLHNDLAITLHDTHPLFSKVTDEQVEAQLTKLQNAHTASKPACDPLKPSISYDDFSALDIRVAKVLEASRVPKTDKLLRLKVDIGSEVRELVAGIAESYEPEQLLGLSVAMVVNLEPRKIRGIESRGMILAVHSEGTLTVVGPQDPCLPGSVIK
ncbi:MAG TPA: methionine--tRNA ligase [Candidatus Cloacimonadota bacterium]|nr:methionine--tRNA ligase [Candidatus Cloacimonadota bacterium]